MKSKSSQTLDRVLSRLGRASRTAAREAIRAGRLKVNGRVVRDPERWVQPELDVVQLDGQRLKPARKIYLLFYKPKGVITSHGDPFGPQDRLRLLVRSVKKGSEWRPSAVWIRELDQTVIPRVRGVIQQRNPRLRKQS
jgi:16S rRNA U516 pseudouridylate synthase RsuA-like enzyme